MPDAFGQLLCLKLCQHNQPEPNKNPCEYCNFAQCDKMPIDGIRDLSSKLLLYNC